MLGVPNLRWQIGGQFCQIIKTLQSNYKNPYFTFEQFVGQARSAGNTMFSTFPTIFSTAAHSKLNSIIS